MLSVQRHRLAGHRLTRKLVALAFVLVLDSLEVGGDFEHLALALDLADKEGNQRGTHNEYQTSNGQNPGPTVAWVHAHLSEHPVETNQQCFDYPTEGPENHSKNIGHHFSFFFGITNPEREMGKLPSILAGISSIPPRAHGLHRTMRHRVIPPPRMTPNCCTTPSPYAEHVG